MEHLRWRLENKITFRRDDQDALMGRRDPSAAPEERTKTTYADVWVGPSQVWYRIEGLALNDKRGLDLMKREILLNGNYAVYQDYNTRAMGTNAPLEPTWIKVIPAMGDATSFEVNQLQLPWDNLWPRTFLAGKVPTTYNGVPVHADGAKVIYRNYAADPEHLLTKAVKNATYLEGDYAGGKLSAVYEFNPWDKSMLRSFRDITWRDGRVVSFSEHEETIQARKLLRPRLDVTCTLESVDDQPCPIKFKKDARVMDYRLCKVVPLNDFPDRSCPPKTYKYDGKLQSLAELQSSEEAVFSSGEAPTANIVPRWVWVLLIFIVCASLTTLMAAIRKGRSMRANTTKD